MTKGKKSISSAESSPSMESSQTKLELRVVREGHRRYVSKLDKEVSEILQRHVEPRDYERLDVIRQLLDGKQRSLSEIDQEVLSLCKVEAIDEEIERSEEVTASILHLKGKIEHASKANTSTERHVESFQAATQPVNQNVVRTGLPKLSLPKFRDVTKWNTFWDSFYSAICA